LSEIEDFAMIKTLATAIKKINECKMDLYYRETKTIEEFMFLIKKIESMLFTHISAHIGLEPLEQTVEDWLLLNKLTLENKKAQQNKISPLVERWQTQFNLYPETY